LEAIGRVVWQPAKAAFSAFGAVAVDFSAAFWENIVVLHPTKGKELTE